MNRYITSIFATLSGIFVAYVASQYNHDWKIYVSAFTMGIAGVCYGHVKE